MSNTIDDLDSVIDNDADEVWIKEDYDGNVIAVENIKNGRVELIRASSTDLRIEEYPIESEKEHKKELREWDWKLYRGGQNHV